MTLDQPWNVFKDICIASADVERMKSQRINLIVKFRPPSVARKPNGNQMTKTTTKKMTTICLFHHLQLPELLRYDLAGMIFYL